MDSVQIYDAHHTFFSPDGKLMASIYDCTLTVRRCKTLSVVQVFHCFDPIKAVKWSPDSQMITCSMPRKNLIEVYNVETSIKVATLDSYLNGGGTCFWGPVSRILLTTEPYLLRAVVWFLDDETCDLPPKVFSGLQPWAKSCVEFSPDGKWMSMVQARSTGDPTSHDNELNPGNNIGDDQVILISCVTWRISKRVECAEVCRVAGISWSPSSEVMVVWSDEPNEPVLFVDVLSADIVTKWHPETNKYFVGLLQVCWSPSGQFVAFMSYNDKVFILSCPKWETIEVLHCREEIEFRDCDIFHEVVEDENSLFDSCCIKLDERPVSISRLREDALCPTAVSPCGNGSKARRHCLWSSGGRYLAVNSILAPASVWIWNVPDGFVLSAVVVLPDRLRDFSWDPVGNTLAMCCGHESVLLWNKEDGASNVACHSATNISSSPAERLTWSPTANMLIVASQNVSRVLKTRDSSVKQKQCKASLT